MTGKEPRYIVKKSQLISKHWLIWDSKRQHFVAKKGSAQLWAFTQSCNANRAATRMNNREEGIGS